MCAPHRSIMSTRKQPNRREITHYEHLRHCPLCGFRHDIIQALESGPIREDFTCFHCKHVFEVELVVPPGAIGDRLVVDGVVVSPLPDWSE